MADDPILLRKLDALLNKHRGTNSLVGSDEREIPVLTDVVEAPTPAAFVYGTAPVGAQFLPASTGVEALSDAEVETLARDIFRAVMAKLGDQLSSDLRDHLTQRLSSIIDSTVATAIADFKQELANTVGDAIAEVLLARAEKAASQNIDPSENPPGSL